MINVTKYELCYIGGSMKIENKYTMWCTNCGKFVTIYADGVDNWADLVCTKCHLIIVTIEEKN